MVRRKTLKKQKLEKHSNTLHTAFTCTKKLASSESSDCYRCVLQCAIFANMTRCDAKPLRVVRSACASNLRRACAHASKTQAAPLARAHAFGNTLALHAHTARQNKKHMPHTENKHATEPHATLTLQHARTSSIAQRMAWLCENENGKMQNERPARPLPRVAFSAVAVLCA